MSNSWVKNHQPMPAEEDLSWTEGEETPIKTSVRIRIGWNSTILEMSHKNFRENVSRLVGFLVAESINFTLECPWNEAAFTIHQHIINGELISDDLGKVHNWLEEQKFQNLKLS